MRTRWTRARHIDESHRVHLALVDVDGELCAEALMASSRTGGLWEAIVERLHDPGVRLVAAVGRKDSDTLVAKIEGGSVKTYRLN